jgi:hypothetical protein
MHRELYLRITPSSYRKRSLALEQTPRISAMELHSRKLLQKKKKLTDKPQYAALLAEQK